MSSGGLSDFIWQDDAECSKKQHRAIAPKFFSSEPRERAEAKNLCYSCPVRKECLKYALEAKELWGVWGGKDESEIRRALSLSHTGREIRRTRFPNCPYCGARPAKLRVIVAPSPEGGRWATMKLVTCDECTFTWRSRTSANAVEAYHASRERAKKKASAKRRPKK